LIEVKTVLITLSLLWQYNAFCQSDSTTTDTSIITQVVFLGTGTPVPNADRSGPSVAILVNNTPYLVDLGPGVVRRAAAGFRKGITGLHYSKLKVAFITHLHSDHTLGYPDFIFTPWVVGRRGPLKVFGPKGIKEMTDHILSAWKEDIDIRENGLGKDLPDRSIDGYHVDVKEILPGIIYKDSNITVTAFLTAHGDWKQTYGYRFQTPDKIIVVSGDTRPTQAVIDNCNGCDILIHEVYTEKAGQESGPEWKAYRSKYHSSSSQVAEIATKAQPKLLVLYHQQFGLNKKQGIILSTEQDLINEMNRFYKGRFISADDLEIIR